jgi:hypothetical protein
VSFFISHAVTVDVPAEQPIARVSQSGDLHIWPQGIGHGPMLGMSLDDWEQIKQSADAAILVARRNRREEW